MTEKKWIDEFSYEDLLRRWRFTTGDTIFQGDNGKYYSKVMFEKRDAEPDGGIAVSKRIGWK